MMAMITVVDSKDRSTFDREIPAVYLFHLWWIMQEASSEAQPNGERQSRSCWLRSVLDLFAEEIQPTEVTPGWRSKVLNPVLVRTFHKTSDFNKKMLSQRALSKCQRGGTSMTVKHWEGFYFNLDVVAPTYRVWWLAMKPIEPERNSDNRTDPALPGGITSLPHIAFAPGSLTTCPTDGRVDAQEQAIDLPLIVQPGCSDQTGPPSHRSPAAQSQTPATILADDEARADFHEEVIPFDEYTDTAAERSLEGLDIISDPPDHEDTAINVTQPRNVEDPPPGNTSPLPPQPVPSLGAIHQGNDALLVDDENNMTCDTAIHVLAESLVRTPEIIPPCGKGTSWHSPHRNDANAHPPQLEDPEDHPPKAIAEVVHVKEPTTGEINMQFQFIVVVNEANSSLGAQERSRPSKTATGCRRSCDYRCTSSAPQCEQSGYSSVASSHIVGESGLDPEGHRRSFM